MSFTGVACMRGRLLRVSVGLGDREGVGGAISNPKAEFGLEGSF